MLFSKKKNFAVIERQHKEDLGDGEKTVLKLNLRYPELQCSKNDPLHKFAKPFYENLSKRFLNFAKTELFNNAKNAPSTAKAPFSALAKFEKSFENEDFLSILIEFSISDGISQPHIEKKTQTWNRSNGFLCSATDFVDENTIKTLKKEHKRNFDKNLFVLKNNGVEFFIGDEQCFVERLDLCAEGKS